MNRFSLAHRSDQALLHDLSRLAARERVARAAVLAHIAEVDARRLFRGAGCPSMHAYCIEVLRFSEDAAFKRIQAARAARQFPAILEAVAAGRLHLSGLGLLVPHLTAANAAELIAAAAHRTRAGIERLLAARFPSSELLELVPDLPEANSDDRPAAGQVEARSAVDVQETSSQLAPGQAGRSEVPVNQGPLDRQVAPRPRSLSLTLPLRSAAGSPARYSARW